MAFNEDIRTRTMISGAALTQFTFVTQAGDGQVDPTGDGLRTDGVVLQSAGGAGKAVTVAYDGRVMVKAGGNINKGAAVASSAAGLAVAATTADIILGYAEEGGANGQIITVRLSRAETAA